MAACYAAVMSQRYFVSTLVVAILGISSCGGKEKPAAGSQTPEASAPAETKESGTTTPAAKPATTPDASGLCKPDDSACMQGLVGQCTKAYALDVDFGAELPMQVSPQGLVHVSLQGYNLVSSGGDIWRACSEKCVNDQKQPLCFPVYFGLEFTFNWDDECKATEATNSDKSVRGDLLCADGVTAAYTVSTSPDAIATRDGLALAKVIRRESQIAKRSGLVTFAAYEGLDFFKISEPRAGKCELFSPPSHAQVRMSETDIALSKTTSEKANAALAAIVRKRVQAEMKRVDDALQTEFIANVSEICPDLRGKDLIEKCSKREPARVGKLEKKLQIRSTTTRTRAVARGIYGDQTMRDTNFTPLCQAFGGSVLE